MLDDFPINLALIIVTSASIIMWAMRFPRDSRLFLSVPLGLTLYFILSTKFFEFGRTSIAIPYNDYAYPTYSLILLLINLMFLSALLGTSISNVVIRPNNNAALHTVGSYDRRLAPNLYKSTRGSIFANISMILISILPVLFIAGYAPIELLMERSGYLFDTVYRPSFIGYADITFWVAAICIPFIKWNGIKYALLASITVAYIMIGARQAPAGIIAFIMIDALFVKQRIMVRHWILGIAALHVLVSIIELRSGPGGLINFLRLFLDPGKLSSENVFLPINYVTNFSVIVNAYGYDYLPTDSRAFWYGISPLPSFVHNDIEYYISKTSIRWYIPYPGLSYLFKHVGVANGCAIVFSLFFLINAARNLIVKNRDALDYAIYSTCVLVPAFFLLQYSIRAPVRLLIIMFLGYFVFSFVREHFLRSRSPIVMAHE